MIGAGPAGAGSTCRQRHRYQPQQHEVRDDEWGEPPGATHATSRGCYEPRLLLNAMASALDEGMSNVTNTIKAAGLWNSCLIVWSADK